ncbi:MAG TPA: CBS domain-containing protein [Anaerolineales bacterium]|nr:CBS domain-containing protein [Anaerolineales bacterium]
MSELKLLQVKDVMETRTVRIQQDANMYRAAEFVAMSHASDLMVVGEDDKFIGVLSEGDILRAALPDMEEISAEGGSVDTAFGIFLKKGKELSSLPILPFVIKEPIVLDSQDHVAKAATLMIDLNIRLLPVIKDGKLVGTISRANICQAVVGNS